jgi:hypothetical protein
MLKDPHTVLFGIRGLAHRKLNPTLCRHDSIVRKSPIIISGTFLTDLSRVRPWRTVENAEQQPHVLEV